MVIRVLFLSLAVSLLSFSGWFTAPANSAAGLTVTVNTTGDGSDLNIGDGLCDSQFFAGNQCTLRAAIEELNAQGSGSSPHRIEFGISGTGPFTITPAPEYPLITVAVEIDGTTQPGAACPNSSAPANLMIVLDGSSAGFGAEGLFLHSGSDGSTIRGMVIGNFESSGISIISDGNQVVCSHLGIGADGETDIGNGVGIRVMGDDNTIGGQVSHWQRNVISNNSGGFSSQGISVSGENNTITNNYIGTTDSGDDFAGNFLGISVSGNNNTIGGTGSIARNVISGNSILGGMEVYGDHNVILGNYIGVAADGLTVLRNLSDGIQIKGDATGNQVGGTANGEANIIAHNAGKGVSIPFDSSFIPLQNEIRGNNIYNNADLGIDLGDDGVTGNDDGDPDGGANGLQNHPVLVSTSGSLIVTGVLDSQPNTAYAVDVFLNESCDPSGYGEGDQYLRSVQAMMDNSGQATFEVDLVGLVSPGNGITATATDPDGNTSEFSNCVTANPVNGTTLTVTNSGDQHDTAPGDYHCDTSILISGDQCSLRAAIEELNALGTRTSMHSIKFDIPGTGPFTITPYSPLPDIQAPMVIDGATQPGAACPTASAPANLLIVLDGSNAGTSINGLVLDTGSDGSIIRGLVIGNFYAAISLYSDGSTILCNYLGLGGDGNSEMSNEVGVLVSGMHNNIGSSSFPNQRNVISGNTATGVYLHESASGNSISHNFIGTTADGMSAAGNHAGGIYIAGSNNFIAGGSLATPGNLISGNNGYGIQIDQGDDNVFLGNYIGVGRDGITSLPNSGNGIEILGDATDNEIGSLLGLRVAENAQIFSGGNLVANNGGHGVMLKNAGGADPDFNQIYLNAIYDNAGLGIDLGDDGVDANDPGDGDGGANAGQNYPVLDRTAGSPVVAVTLESQANSDYEIDFYRSHACDASGYGEGQEYLETVPVTTDGSGHASFEVDLARLVSLGDAITATAKGAFETTSEFSNCLTLTDGEAEYSLYLPLVWR